MNSKLKYLLLAIIGLVVISISIQAKKKRTKSSEGIHWVSVEEAEKLMSKNPKKVYIDIYTNWCSWCKVMDKKTFTNANVIAYLNEHYYCIHFNAEDTKPIMLKGKKYGAYENSKNHALAVEWMRGQLSYPTSIFMDENFENPLPVPGYMEVAQMELIAKYIAENKHKTMPFETYQKDFIGNW